MRNRIPADAFEFYRGLGPGRSYAAVAAKYGVSVRGIAKRASKEDWRGRLARIEAEARSRMDSRAAADRHEVDERHLRTARVVVARGLEALRTMPLHSAVAAVRAIEAGVRMERAVLGVDRKPDDATLQWSSILEEVRQRAEAREASKAAQVPAAPPPVVPQPAPAPSSSRWPFGEN